ncbi:uroporphyrinogen-III synthase [Brachybacterium huguangmaarense]
MDPAAQPAPAPSGELPLAGRRVAVTAHRRADEQAAALERQGAEVVRAATMRVVPVGEDPELLAETEALLAARPRALLVTTGQGFTTWLDALPAPLRERTEAAIASMAVFCRGAKARGAVRGRGFEDPPSAPGETTESLVDIVLAAGVRDVPVGLQRHGWLDERQVDRLREAGCDVHVVAPYRWLPGEDQAAVAALVEEIIAGRLDAVTFTAGAAVEALLATARRLGREDALLDALREGRALAVAVGHVTAEPLQAVGIPVVFPERERLGAMIRLLVDELA